MIALTGHTSDNTSGQLKRRASEKPLKTFKSNLNLINFCNNYIGNSDTMQGELGNGKCVSLWPGWTRKLLLVGSLQSAAFVSCRQPAAPKCIVAQFVLLAPPPAAIPLAPAPPPPPRSTPCANHTAECGCATLNFNFMFIYRDLKEPRVSECDGTVRGRQGWRRGQRVLCCVSCWARKSQCQWLNLAKAAARRKTFGPSAPNLCVW